MPLVGGRVTQRTLAKSGQIMMPMINQTIQEVVELENLVGRSRDIGPLGERSHIGGVGCDAYAIGIRKNEQ
jgi:hypothetical protein